jgi:hypothetical protein
MDQAVRQFITSELVPLVRAALREVAEVRAAVQTLTERSRCLRMMNSPLNSTRICNSLPRAARTSKTRFMPISHSARALSLKAMSMPGDGTIAKKPLELTSLMGLPRKFYNSAADRSSKNAIDGAFGDGPGAEELPKRGAKTTYDEAWPHQAVILRQDRMQSS